MGFGRFSLLLEVVLSLAFWANLWYSIYMMKNEKQQPIFTEKQLNNLSQENMSQVILLMQANQQELEKKQKIMEEKMHELEFMNALLSDRLTLAQKKQFGASSEKYADGYQSYHRLPERITVTGCFAHARRRFNDCLTIMKNTFTKEQLKETTAHQAMSRIGMLYKIEALIRDKSPEEKYLVRQKQSKPLLEAYFE